MLFKLIDGKKTETTNGVVLIKATECGYWNTTIRKAAKKFNINLHKHGVGCKKQLN